MHRVGTAKPVLSTKAALKIIGATLTLLIFFFFLLAGNWISGSPDSPQSAEQPNLLPHSLPPISRPDWSIPCMDIAVGQDSTTIQIRPDQWTKPIRLPPNTKFMIDHPGEMEYCFQTGERILAPGGVDSNLKRVPHRIFALRGAEGEIRIIILE